MKPNNDIENNIDANTNEFLETIDNIRVDIILRLANSIKNIFLLENLSDNNPNNGAMKIRIMLAVEFDIPR